MLRRALPLFREALGRVLHLEVVLLSVVRLTLGRRHLEQPALPLCRLCLGCFPLPCRLELQGETTLSF